jgi:FtsH-binding integral membrane protein
MSTWTAPAQPATSRATLFSRVMGLVAGTIGFATLGAYLGRDAGGAAWFVAWLLGLGCLIGLNVASARGENGLALGLLFAFGALMGFSAATTVNYYAQPVLPAAARPRPLRREGGLQGRLQRPLDLRMTVSPTRRETIMAM